MVVSSFEIYAHYELFVPDVQKQAFGSWCKKRHVEKCHCTTSENGHIYVACSLHFMHDLS